MASLRRCANCPMRLAFFPSQSAIKYAIICGGRSLIDLSHSAIIELISPPVYPRKVRSHRICLRENSGEKKSPSAVANSDRCAPEPGNVHQENLCVDTVQD